MIDSHRGRQPAARIRFTCAPLGMIEGTGAGVTDVWMQHPTLRHSQHEMFDSLRRWMGAEAPTQPLPLELTIRAMDEGGVEIGLTAAWYGPDGDLISNDEVAECVRRYPPLRPSETGRPIPYIDEVAIDFPELVIVCGHIGYPWTTEMIAVADKHPNVYIDTSAYSVSRYPAELVEYLRGRGRTKVLFGTNYPMMTPARALAKMPGLGLDDEVTSLFLGENARRIFNLD